MICQFRSYRPESFNLSSRKLRSYWIEVHQIFTKVAKTLPCNILKSELRYTNSFRNISATNEGGVNQVHFWPPKLIGYHGDVPWKLDDGKRNVRFIIRTHRSTNCGNLVKIDPVLSEIFGGKCQLLAIVQNVCNMKHRTSFYIAYLKCAIISHCIFSKHFPESSHNKTD